MLENVYRILAAAIVLAGFSVSVYFRRRADWASGGEAITLNSENPILMISLPLVGITLWLSVLAYLLKPDWMVWSQIQLLASVQLGGAALGASAAVLAYWVISILGNNMTATMVTLDHHKLVQLSPYRWIRHPL